MSDQICEHACLCDKLNSNGEKCRHGYPHPKNSECKIECRVKPPFCAVCRPVRCDQHAEDPREKYESRAGIPPFENWHDMEGARP
jgi:hypothetical protein